MKTSRSLVPALLLLLLAVPAMAAPPPLTGSLSYASQIVTNRAFDATSENDNLSMSRVAVGYGLLLGDRRLDLEFAYQGGTNGAKLHQSRDAALWFRGIELGAAYRIPLARYFVPYARLSVGYDWATLSVGGDALFQRVGHPSATGLAGFTIPVISVSDQGVLHDWVIFDLGVGYALRPAYAFSALGQPESSTQAVDPIARAPVDMGKLGLSGITFRIGLSLWL